MSRKKKKPSTVICAESVTDFDIYRWNCGALDVHSTLVVATVGVTDRQTLITTYTQRHFGTFTCDLKEMSLWILSFGCRDVVMESTGKYMIPVCDVLEDNGITYTVTHPKYCKSPDGHKDDDSDSLRMCKEYKYNLLPKSFIPPRQIRECRDLGRRYVKLTYEKTAEKNRFENSMVVCNLNLDQVFSDPFGKSATAVMEEVLNNPVIDEDKILKLVDPRCKKKDKVIDAIRGMNRKPDQMFKMNDISLHMEELDSHRSNVLAEIVTRLSPDYEKFEKITTIPGISTLSAYLIISEIGYDMSVWDSDKQLVYWAGLAPKNDQSNGKKKTTRIGKGGHYLKPLLVQCALAAIKDKKGYFFKKYNNIKSHRGHKKAIIATARLILTCIYHVIKTNTEFNPVDYDKVMNPPEFKKKYKVNISAHDAITILQAQGYDVSSLIDQNAQLTDKSPI